VQASEEAGWRMEMRRERKGRWGEEEGKERTFKFAQNTVHGA